MNSSPRIESLLWLASPMAAWSQASNMPATVPRQAAQKRAPGAVADTPRRKRAKTVG